MLIALDYDHTYTLDPAFWDGLIAMAAAKDYRVICLTMRYPHEAISLPCEVIYTSRKAKKPYADALGLHVDVWIDDAPHFLFTDAAETAPPDAGTRKAPLSSPVEKPSVYHRLRRLVGRAAVP